jgi:hypothetical protein
MLTFLIGMSIEDISWNTFGHAITDSILMTENLRSSGMALSIARETLLTVCYIRTESKGNEKNYCEDETLMDTA